MSIFKPNEILNKYSDLDIKGLKDKGFNVCFLDVDNTITPYDSKTPDEKAKKFVKSLKDNGFEVIVISNNTNKRVSKTAKEIDCEYSCWSFKPLPFKLNRLIKQKGLDKKKIFMMGDQLLTDVLCANNLGIYSIYSKPISEVETFYSSISRKIERFIFKHILHEEV